MADVIKKEADEKIKPPESGSSVRMSIKDNVTCQICKHVLSNHRILPSPLKHYLPGNIRICLIILK